MKKTVNIRFLLELLLGIVILVLLVIFFWEAYELKKNEKDSQKQFNAQNIASEKSENRSEETLATDALYLLKLEQDNVVIYHASNGEVYDKTDISVEALPEDLMQKLQQGIPVYSLKELYDFLENYSS